MKILTSLLIVLPLAACAVSDQDRAARNWQMAECNRVPDNMDRTRCIERVERNYGR